MSSCKWELEEEVKLKVTVLQGKGWVMVMKGKDTEMTAAPAILHLAEPISIALYLQYENALKFTFLSTLLNLNTKNLDWGLFALKYPFI